MELTALHALCLVSVVTLTTQELVSLSVSPKVTAECGRQVALQCNVSSSLDGLSVKHMAWTHSRMDLCSVNGEGNVTYGGGGAAFSDFYCEYEAGRLSLVFREMRPELESRHPEDYGCKLRSNKGAPHAYTTVELEECAEAAPGVLTDDGPSCTFNRVHPDGDVHWFLGSEKLSDGPATHNTSKRVEDGGWLAVHSHLRWSGPDAAQEWTGTDAALSCFLKSTVSRRYIARALIPKAEVQEQTALTRGASHSPKNAVRPRGSTTGFLCASLLFCLVALF